MPPVNSIKADNGMPGEDFIITDSTVATASTVTMPSVRFSSEIPSVYEMCHKQFGVEWDDGVVFTVGNTIHSKFPLSQDLIVHEMRHIIQQEKMGTNEWWALYMKDPDFRLTQELEAYIAQANYLRKAMKDRNARFKYIWKLAKDLGGPMYGNIITSAEAYDLLTK